MQIIGNWEDTANTAPLLPFSDSILAFFNELSKQLIKERKYTDVATFGFWCRKASLIKEKANYDDLDKRLGRGVVFHSTPSNVPVNFAFSFAVGLLAGNANIVRIPSKDFAQVRIIVDAIKTLVNGKHSNLVPYICFVKYPSDRKMHDLFSSVCDVRIIWGGDNTINELRESPLKPKAFDLTFADRYSIAIINTDEYLKAQDKKRIAQDFYNDTYFTDQNACTTPGIIFWIGNSKDIAKNVFWENVHQLVKAKYALVPIQSVNKLSAFYNAAINASVELIDTIDNYITRLNVYKVNSELMNLRYNSGFFFEHDINKLDDILPICGERLQTLTYYGLTTKEIISFITTQRPKGIDRAVPMGKSMDFSLTWDGYDLIRQLSRKVQVL